MAKIKDTTWENVLNQIAGDLVPSKFNVLDNQIYDLTYELIKEIPKVFHVKLYVNDAYKNLFESLEKEFIFAFMGNLGCDDLIFEINEKMIKNECKYEQKGRLMKLGLHVQSRHLAEIEGRAEQIKKSREKALQWKENIENHKKVEEGYIYILSNKELGRTYKIGFVRENVLKRAKAFKYETGLEKDFVIKKIWKTKNPYEVEQKIFESLQMQKNEKGEYDSSYGKCYRISKFLNGKTFNEFVRGASLKFFCERIERFIQH